MDAVSDREYTVYFGGGYTEHWTDDYIMSVTYYDRQSVTAKGRGDRWKAVGDRELSARIASERLYSLYFHAAATAYDAAQDCLRRGLTLNNMPRLFRFGDNPLIAPELLRLLMDDCGFGLDTAFSCVAGCCRDLYAEGIDENELLTVQPRTAHVIKLLRELAAKTLTLRHEPDDPSHRSPYGAVKTGELVRLGFELVSGELCYASLLVYGDDYEREYPLARIGKIYSAVAAFDTPQALWYRFKVQTSDGERYLCKSGLCETAGEGFRLTVYDKNFETTSWFRESVMYQIFPDRFACSDDDTARRGIEYHRRLGQTPDLHESIDEPVKYLPRPWEKEYTPDDFYGGTLKGIISRLDYLQKLGISCLYLNPIVEARSNHRYDTSDYRRVDPILGTNEDFSLLCEECEKRGIRVILDGVFSHTGCDSVYFNRYGNYPTKGACQGEDSAYYDWYDFKQFPDEYRCWWGFKDLPEVDELNPTWQDFVVSGEDSIVKTWLRRGSSGWRLDVADELPDEALALIRKAVKEVKPDAPIIGEVWEDAVTKKSYGSRRNYALGYSLDSVMNYPFRAAVLDFLCRRKDAFALAELLTEQRMHYPLPLYGSLMNLLGSHDVERVRNALAVELVIKELSREDQLALRFTDEALSRALRLEKLGAVIQFTVPGVPSIYYGDEQGMCGVGDPFNRAPFKLGNAELAEFYAGLSKFRQSSPVLTGGEVRYVPYSPDVLMIHRYTVGEKDIYGRNIEDGEYLIVINRSDTETEFCFDDLSGFVTAEDFKIIRIK